MFDICVFSACCSPTRLSFSSSSLSLSSTFLLPARLTLPSFSTPQRTSMAQCVVHATPGSIGPSLSHVSLFAPFFRALSYFRVPDSLQRRTVVNFTFYVIYAMDRTPLTNFNYRGLRVSFVNTLTHPRAILYPNKKTNPSPRFLKQRVM